MSKYESELAVTLGCEATSLRWLRWWGHFIAITLLLFTLLADTLCNSSGRFSIIVGTTTTYPAFNVTTILESRADTGSGSHSWLFASPHYLYCLACSHQQLMRISWVRQLHARWVRKKLCWFFHWLEHSEWCMHSSKDDKLSVVLRVATAHYALVWLLVNGNSTAAQTTDSTMVLRTTTAHYILSVTISECRRYRSWDNRFFMVLRPFLHTFHFI
jgi:hypothetical protein